jgi:hypothetical protein
MEQVYKSIKENLRSCLINQGSGCFLGFLFLGLIFTSNNVVNAQNLSPIFGQKNTVGIGPRAIGMGGAFTAVADDASAAYWNVAGLAQLSSYELSISSAPVYFKDHMDGTSPIPPPNGTTPIPAFGFPWYSSIQFMMPIAKENTLGLSLFRPFHTQQDFYSGNTVMSTTQREENSYLQNPSFQQSEILLSYAARFSAVKNFSVGINVKRITNDPYYIRYFGSDPSIATQLENPIRVIGFGVDVGILYRIPITKYSEEFRIGLALNDLVGSAQYSNGFNLGSSLSTPPITILVGPGFETPIPPEITLGFAYKNDFFFKIRNITDIDFDQISDPRIDDADNKTVRFGTEFWFFRDVLGIRAGYSTPLSRPGMVTLGMSIRALNGDFETDAAYLLPVSPSASVSQGSAIGTYDTSGINFEPFWIGVAYRFGGGDEIPPPKVNAYVRPNSFTPSNGEKATFYLDTSEDVTVDHWTVLIYDKDNHLARGLRGHGTPPTKVIWGGEDDTYQPLLPGVYTWAFQVEDNLGHIGSTPVQTVEILAPPTNAIKDTAKLFSIRQQQQALLTQERAQLTKLAQDNLKVLLGTTEGEPNTLSGTASTPTQVEASGNTLYPEAGGVPALGFNNLSADQVLNTHFEKNTEGKPIIVVNYRSKLTIVPYLYQEAAEVIKTTVNSVGTGLKEISTRVYYGKNELSLLTPTEAAANYASGKIQQLQLLQLSDIHINGEKVGPNGY